MSRVSASTWWCEWAWLGGESAHREVVIETAGGRITDVDVGGRPPTDAVRLDGLTIPALANVHSHAFHRLLRARTHGGEGDFWTWRNTMYSVAGQLEPESYYQLALGVFAEMAEAGIAAVGEFHYIHHRPDGTPYGPSAGAGGVDGRSDIIQAGGANAMGLALTRAASEVGIRITLLDTLYLHGGLGPDGYEPLRPEQRRFGDGSVAAWVDRRRAWPGGGSDLVRRGAAIHSVRAVDIAAAARYIDRAETLHVHVSEQPGENEACLVAHGMTPTSLLAHHGLLGPNTTIIHGTHLDDDDLGLLAGAGSGCCFCPTTERELADGIGPSHALVTAGVDLSLGSDSHAVIDLFEEARAVELNQRLATLQRGVHQPDQLLTMATANGYKAIGWDGGGRIEVGARADLATIKLDSPRTAGTPPGAAIVFSATASDVHHVMVNGRVVVKEGRHVSVDPGLVIRRMANDMDPSTFVVNNDVG